MKTKDLTSQQRIVILEDVLRKLEDLDDGGGLCVKIQNSAFELFSLRGYETNEIIPLFTFENAKKVTKVKDRANKEYYWWEHFYFYDFENRIKMVKWMINEEKLTNNI